MGLESATYINGLVDTNPSASDNANQGDNHLRLIKSAIKTTFPNVTGAVTVSHSDLNTVTGKLNLTGGTLTGALNGTSASFSGRVTADNIGIGTTTPAGKLHIANGSDGEAFRVQRTGGTNATILRVNMNEANNTGTIEVTAAAGNPALVLATAGSSRVHITDSGNIGIGNGLPTEKLDVTGTVKATAFSGPITGNVTGNVTGNATNITGVAAIPNGGTGASDAGNARTNLDVPSRAGSGASGTWNINVAGNAGTVTSITSGQVTTALGFTPVQQGGGTGQGTNKVYIGWLGTQLGLQVDTTNYSNLWPIGISGNAGTATTATTATTANALNTGNSYTMAGLTVNGSITATGDITAFSDSRTKMNIETITEALYKVKALRGVSYVSKFNMEERIGVVAQEVERVVPEVVHTHTNGLKSVAYQNLVGLLIEAIKALELRVAELESR